MIKLSLVLSIVFTYLLMIMGNIVTTTGSGLACPDWPLCYGSVTPPLQLDIWFEWGHRLLGGATGLLILLSTALTWTKLNGPPKWLTASALGLLGLGALLGGVIVLIEAPLLDGPLHLAVISFHIVLATIIFTLLVFSLRSLADASGEGGGAFYAIVFGVSFVQALLGILVRYSQASLACPDFPLCRGAIFPDLTDAEVTLHFLHRLTALAIFILVSGYLVNAAKTGRDLIKAVITFALVLIQATFGAYIIWSGMFLPYIVLHGATGFFILGWFAYWSAPVFVGTNTPRGAAV